ncbi:MAG: type IV pilus modification protein PilV [Gallionella sp.]|nr:type IV pilus modification protein PilV [Gallionella sp.]
MKTPNKHQAFQQGFSMLEILITLVIVATALLGTAGLQAHALKTNMGGQFRNQAVFLSADIAERMEANKVQAVLAGGYALAAGAAIPAASTACNTGPCTPAQLAQYDLANWQAAIAAVLPQGTGVITQTVVGNPSTYTIVINWVDRATNQISAGSAVANAGRSETYSITTDKTIRN